MLRLAQRTLHGLLLLAGVSIFSFALLCAAPGNFFDELKLDSQVSPETIAFLKNTYGVDRPMPVRYARWLASIVRGEFGYSMSYHCGVASLLWPRARNTVLLTSLATLLAWAIALPWGLLEAAYRKRWVAHVGGALTAVLLATPQLLVGLLFVLLAARTRWFPTGGMTSVSVVNDSVAGRGLDIAKHLFLPVVALALGAAPLLVRHVRSAVVTVLESPFLEAARSHGIRGRRLIFRQVLPAASNSLISLLGFSIGGLVSMSLLMEVVLGWPGLGPLVLEGLLARDIYVVLAAVMLSSVFLMAGNLLADALLYWSDPRIRTVS